MTTRHDSHRFMVWITLVVALLSMLGPFSIDTYMPSFPDIAKDLQATSLQMQQTMSFYMAGFAVMNLFYGSLSDALGRRKVILVALFFYIVSSIACTQVNDIHSLLWLRAAQGVFASAGMIVGRAVVRDLFEGPRAQRVISHSIMWFALAPAFAPVIGGWLHTTWDWRSVFWFLALFAALVWLLVANRLKETLPVEQRQPMHPVYLLKTYYYALTHGRFINLSLSMGTFFAAFMLYIASAPMIIYQHLGLGANDFIYLFGPMVTGVMLGSFFSGRVAEHWPRPRMVVVGYSIMLLAACANIASSLLFEASELSLMLPLSFYAMGMAFMMPLISVMGLDCLPNNRGLASSLMGFIQMALNALVAGMVAPLLFDSTQKLALGMAAFILSSLALYVSFVRQRAA